jgi:hypothetical protein
MREIMSVGISHNEEGMTYSLDEELKHKPGSRKTSECIWEHPRRDQTCADECSDAHRTPATNPLREIADDGTANASTSLHQNACCGGYAVVHTFFGQQEGGVAVLRGMRVEVEPCHQDDGVNAQPPLLRQHGFNLAPEDACADALMSSSFAVTELFRLREPNTEQAYTDGQASCDPLFNLQSVSVTECSSVVLNIYATVAEDMGSADRPSAEEDSVWYVLKTMLANVR